MLATSYSTNNCSYSFYSTLIKQIKKIISNLKLYNLSNIEDVLIAKIDTKKAINDLLSFFYEKRSFDLENSFNNFFAHKELYLIWQLLESIDDLILTVNNLVEMIGLYSDQREKISSFSYDLR